MQAAVSEIRNFRSGSFFGNNLYEIFHKCRRSVYNKLAVDLYMYCMTDTFEHRKAVFAIIDNPWDLKYNNSIRQQVERRFYEHDRYYE